MKKMTPIDFYKMEYDNYDLVYHIQTSQFYKLAKRSPINSFFQNYLKQRELTEEEILIKDYIQEEINKNTSLRNITEEKSLSKIENKYNFNEVILPIAGVCNLKCSYCFAQTKNGFGFNSITFNQAKEILDFSIKNKSSHFPCRIHFFGGEPMLNFNIIKEVVQYAKNEYSEEKVEFGITTNGTVINQEIINFIKEENIGVLLSIDGPAEIAPHRIFKNGKHSFDKVLKNILKLKKNNIGLQLRATIPSDCKNLVSIYDFFESLNTPFAAVLAYKSINQTNLAEYVDEYEKFKRLYKELKDYYAKRIKNNEPIQCYSITGDINKIKNRRTSSLACGAGINLFAITDEGNIFSCEHLAFDKSYAIGDIRSGIDKRKIEEMRPKLVEQIDHCKDCWVKYLCSGGCFSSQKLTTIENSASFEDECSLKRLYWEFILMLYYEVKELTHSNIKNEK